MRTSGLLQFGPEMGQSCRIRSWISELVNLRWSWIAVADERFRTTISTDFKDPFKVQHHPPNISATEKQFDNPDKPILIERVPRADLSPRLALPHLRLYKWRPVPQTRWHRPDLDHTLFAECTRRRDPHSLKVESNMEPGDYHMPVNSLSAPNSTGYPALVLTLAPGRDTLDSLHM